MPSHATRWEAALTPPAIAGIRKYQREMHARLCYAHKHRTFEGAPAVTFFAFGLEGYTKWARKIIQKGYMLRMGASKLKVFDTSHTPHTHMSREIVEEVLRDSPDHALRDTMLTHGVSFLADLEHISMFADHLLGLPAGFDSLHSEIARLAKKGWYE